MSFLAKIQAAILSFFASAHVVNTERRERAEERAGEAERALEEQENILAVEREIARSKERIWRMANEEHIRQHNQERAGVRPDLLGDARLQQRATDTPVSATPLRDSPDTNAP